MYFLLYYKCRCTVDVLVYMYLYMYTVHCLCRFLWTAMDYQSKDRPLHKVGGVRGGGWVVELGEEGGWWS